MTPRHDDQKYIDALLQNDGVLLKEIYIKYSAKIKRLVTNNNGTEDDAADIFQESLIAIYQKATKGEFFLSCPFEAYLYLICKNKWINELNKKSTRRVTSLVEDGYTYGDDSFAQAAIAQNEIERKQLLTKKLNELGGSCKELLELAWQGMSMEEVAKKLKNTYGYARKKKSECMGKLISLVKNDNTFAQLQW